MAASKLIVRTVGAGLVSCAVLLAITNGPPAAGEVTRSLETVQSTSMTVPAEPGDVCGGFAGLPCDEGEFCKFGPGRCDIVDDEGVCTTIPEVCPTIFDPVCGCDGVTYSNECFADMAGVSLDYRGPCDEGDICGGIGGIPCDEGEFCKFGPGRCEIVDDQGACVVIPEICPLIYDPVCGCDGVTYSNECFADMATVSIDLPGECCETEANCPKADVNCDGIADGFDIAEIRNGANWLMGTLEAAVPRCDVNRDGLIDGFDIAAVRQGECWLQ